MTDEPVDDATDEEVRADAARLAALLAKLTPPSYPVTTDWGLSVADIIASRWPLPGPLRRVLRLLDRFGAVRVTPDGMSLDGKQVAWEDLREVQLVPLYDALRQDAVDQTVDQISVWVPPVPGRKWLLRRLVALVVALAERYAPQDRATSPLVPLTLVRQGLLGRRVEVTGGLVAAVLLSVVPQTTDVVVRTAQERGLPVSRPEGFPPPDVPPSP